MSRFLPAALAVLACAAPAPAAGPFDELLPAVSPNTNTLVLINVQAAMASPLAKAEKWSEAAQRDSRGAFGFIPPETSVAVIASEVNLSSMSRDFQVGLVRMRNVPSMRELASREGGTTDEIAGRISVLSPRDVYFTTLSGSELAAVFPADRQYTARWIRQAMAAKEPRIVPYLKKVVDAAADATVTIGVDLQDAVDPTIIRFGLGVSPVMVKHKGANLDNLARFIARVQGLTFTAKVTDAVAGTVRVDFGFDPAPFRNFLKDLFLELVDSFGISIAGMEKWEAKFDATSMTLTGRMDPADLRRVVSLFSFPSASPEDTPPPKDKDEASGPATQRYMAAVGAILADIRKVRDTGNFEKSATWHDQSAAQIEQLSRLHVDKIAVDAAFEAAKRLRAIGASLRGVPINLEALQQQGYAAAAQSITWNGGWGGWWGGWRSWGINPGPIFELQGRMAQVVADDQKNRLQAWSQIDQMMIEARKKLTDKYKLTF